MAIILTAGDRFARLVVIALAPARSRTGALQWRCRCDCGNDVTVPGSSLNSGNTRSCGCLHKEEVGSLRRTHGLSGTRAYRAVVAARHRTGAKSSHPAHYAGRGIEYRLPADYGEATRAVIDSIGECPSNLELDRIDNDGHYEIGNLRWATRSQQNRNRRGPRLA